MCHFRILYLYLLLFSCSSAVFGAAVPASPSATPAASSARRGRSSKAQLVPGGFDPIPLDEIEQHFGIASPSSSSSPGGGLGTSSGGTLSTSSTGAGAFSDNIRSQAPSLFPERTLIPQQRVLAREQDGFNIQTRPDPNAQFQDAEGRQAGDGFLSNRQFRFPAPSEDQSRPTLPVMPFPEESLREAANNNNFQESLSGFRSNQEPSFGENQFGASQGSSSQFGGNPSQNSQFGGNPSQNSQFGGNPSQNSQFGGNPTQNSQFGSSNPRGESELRGTPKPFVDFGRTQAPATPLNGFVREESPSLRIQIPTNREGGRERPPSSPQSGVNPEVLGIFDKIKLQIQTRLSSEGVSVTTPLPNIPAQPVVVPAAPVLPGGSKSLFNNIVNRINTGHRSNAQRKRLQEQVPSQQEEVQQQQQQQQTPSLQQQDQLFRAQQQQQQQFPTKPFQGQQQQQPFQGRDVVIQQQQQSFQDPFQTNFQPTPRSQFLPETTPRSQLIAQSTPRSEEVPRNIGVFSSKGVKNRILPSRRGQQQQQQENSLQTEDRAALSQQSIIKEQERLRNFLLEQQQLQEADILKAEQLEADKQRFIAEEEEQRRLQKIEEEAQRKKAEEEERRRKSELEARRKKEEEAKRKIAEEEARKVRIEEEARRKQAEEEERRKKEEDERRERFEAEERAKKEEAERKRKVEEALRQRQEEESRRNKELLNRRIKEEQAKLRERAEKERRDKEEFERQALLAAASRKREEEILRLKERRRLEDERREKERSQEEDRSQKEEDVFNQATDAVRRKTVRGEDKSSPAVWAAVKSLSEFLEAKSSMGLDTVPRPVLMAIIQLTEFLESEKDDFTPSTAPRRTTAGARRTTATAFRRTSARTTTTQATSTGAPPTTAAEDQFGRRMKRPRFRQRIRGSLPRKTTRPPATQRPDTTTTANLDFPLLAQFNQQLQRKELNREFDNFPEVSRSISGSRQPVQIAIKDEVGPRFPTREELLRKGSLNFEKQDSDSFDVKIKGFEGHLSPLETVTPSPTPPPTPSPPPPPASPTPPSIPTTPFPPRIPTTTFSPRVPTTPSLPPPNPTALAQQQQQQQQRQQLQQQEQQQQQQFQQRQQQQQQNQQRIQQQQQQQREFLAQTQEDSFDSDMEGLSLLSTFNFNTLPV